MKVEVNEIGELQRRLTFRLPSEALKKATQEKFRVLGSTVRLSEFSPVWSTVPSRWHCCEGVV